MNLFFLLILSSLNANCAAPIWIYSDSLNKPTSVFSDLASGALYVANEGFLAKLDKEGHALSKAWTKGLRNPHGMRSYDRSLWVVDGADLLEYSWKSGKLQNSKSFPETASLADIAIWRDGSIYLTDRDRGVFAVHGSKLDKIFPELKTASALLFLLDDLYLASGRNFYRLDLKSKKKDLLWVAPEEISTLEYSSAQAWILATAGGKVFRFFPKQKKAELCLDLHEKIGRGVYFYEHDTALDLLILPFPDKNEVRAYHLTKR